MTYQKNKIKEQEEMGDDGFVATDDEKKAASFKTSSVDKSYSSSRVMTALLTSRDFKKYFRSRKIF